MHNAGVVGTAHCAGSVIKAMRTITLEEHISTPEFFEATTKAWQGKPLGDLWTAQRSKLLDVEKDRLSEMDAAGIDMQVLSLSGVGMEILDPATATAVASVNSPPPSRLIRTVLPPSLLLGSKNLKKLR